MSPPPRSRQATSTGSSNAGIETYTDLVSGDLPTIQQEPANVAPTPKPCHLETFAQAAPQASVSPCSMTRAITTA